MCAWSWGHYLQSFVSHACNVFPALIAIGRYSTTIETVDVGWCKEITDRGATQIAQRSKSLRYLGLMRCDQVRSLSCTGARFCLWQCSSVWVREAAGFMCFWTNMFSVHYCGNCSGVLCSHMRSSKGTQRTRRSILNVCWHRLAEFIWRLRLQPKLLTKVFVKSALWQFWIFLSESGWYVVL